LEGIADCCGPQVAQEKESVRPVYPPEKAREVLDFTAFPLPEPLGPHVGQFAEGNRVADDAKFAIDEIAIVSYPSLTDLP